MLNRHLPPHTGHWPNTSVLPRDVGRRSAQTGPSPQVSPACGLPDSPRRAPEGHYLPVLLGHHVEMWLLFPPDRGLGDLAEAVELIVCLF